MIEKTEVRMVYSVVCRRIKELRIQHSMTQLELAAKLGVSKSVVSSYENCVHLPPYDILIRLSALFGVSCDYLLGVSETQYISTEGLTDAQIKALQLIAEELRRVNG